MKSSLLYCILISINLIRTLDASYSRPTSAFKKRQEESLAIIAARDQKQKAHNSSSKNLRKTTLQKLNNKITSQQSFNSDSETDLDITQSNCETISQWIENFNSNKQKPIESKWIKKFHTEEAILPLSHLSETNIGILTSHDELKPKHSNCEPQISPSFKKKQEKMKKIHN